MLELSCCFNAFNQLPISSGAGQHFVDANNVIRMDPNSHVERVFATELDKILVGTDASSLKSLR